MRVLDHEDVCRNATKGGWPWGALDVELPWRDALRAHVAAEGAVLRRTLVDRVLRWHGVSPSDAHRDQVHAWIDDLDAVGDLLVGAAGLIGAAPVRAARIRGTNTALLLGSVGNGELRETLPNEVIENRRVRRVVLTWHDDDALARAMGSIGAAVTDADAWAGLDRAPATLELWWSALSSRAPRDADRDARLDDAQAYVVRDGRGRWRARGDAGSDGPWLLRSRQPGGWFRFGWERDGAVLALTSDEATRTRLTLEARAGAGRAVVATRRATGEVEFSLPGRLPRAEYRMLLGTGDVTADARGVRVVTALDVWPSIAAMLRERVGWTIDEAGVLA